MSEVQIRHSMENLGNALTRLDDVLSRPLNEDNRDITILRFTIVFELGWKTLRRFLLYDKVPRNEIASPRDALKKSYQVYWITDDQLWLNMADDRNNLVHTYDEELANAVYERIKNRYAPEFHRIFEFLKDKFADILA